MKELFLPSWAAGCLQRLENAGFAAYAVGGCVRDACLGLTPNDYDLCTAALPEQIQQVFKDSRLVLAGLKHGTVGVITPGGVVEITTFRSEGGYEDNRHPDWVHFEASVEKDLARRDFTINAMAWSPRRGFADPFGGREDLKNGILRAVGDPVRRFQEDALRILRGARFAVRFSLSVEEKTLEAMNTQAFLLEHLARERVFEELCRFLLLAEAEDFGTFLPVLTAAVPELGPMAGFDQHNPHHIYDVYTHTAHVTAAVPGDLALRWAALLHDVGKPRTFTVDGAGVGHFYGHEKESAAMAEEILRRLKAPTALREQAVLLIGEHMKTLPADRKLLRRRVSRLGWENTEKLWHLQAADIRATGTRTPEELAEFEKVRQLLEALRREDACLGLKDLQVNGHDLLALGLQGKAVGQCLQRLLELVLDEKLPNRREALLEEASRNL